MPLGPVVPGSYVSATPDANPATSRSLNIAPSATMPVVGADLQVFELAMLNEVNSSELNEAAISSITDATDGMRIFSKVKGWYRALFAGTPFTPDGSWILAAAITGHPLAQWINQLWNMVIAQNIPSIGPVPGETTTVATAAGRINPQFVPYGHFTHQIETPSQYTTASTALVTPGVPGTGAALATWTIGDVNANDIIVAHIPATGSVTSASGFQACLLISFDNGTTYAMMSPVAPGGGTGPVVYDTTGTTSSFNVDLIGAKVTPGGGGTCKVQLRGASVVAGTTKVSTGMGWIEVRRP